MFGKVAQGSALTPKYILFKSPVHLAQRGKTHFWLSDSFQNIKLITVARRTLLRKSSSGEKIIQRKTEKNAMHKIL